MCFGGHLSWRRKPEAAGTNLEIYIFGINMHKQTFWVIGQDEIFIENLKYQAGIMCTPGILT